MNIGKAREERNNAYQPNSTKHVPLQPSPFKRFPSITRKNEKKKRREKMNCEPSHPSPVSTSALPQVVGFEQWERWRSDKKIAAHKTKEILKLFIMRWLWLNVVDRDRRFYLRRGEQTFHKKKVNSGCEVKPRKKGAQPHVNRVMHPRTCAVVAASALVSHHFFPPAPLIILPQHGNFSKEERCRRFCMGCKDRRPWQCERCGVHIFQWVDNKKSTDVYKPICFQTLWRNRRWT